MVIASIVGFTIAFIMLSAQPAFAWGPVTHVALGMQVLASVITPEHPLQAVLASMPEAFLYGSLAPDIVQGRRLQSRLRRHSHNWATGFRLLASSSNDEERVFALGYLAHLSSDVVAHNFFLPARFIGRFDSAVASHILTEARFDAQLDASYRDILIKLMRNDFRSLDNALSLQIDSPLLPFRAQKRIFEGGMRRIREWHRLISAVGIGRPQSGDDDDIEIFCSASCSAICGMFDHGSGALACTYDPMGQRAVGNAMHARRSLLRLLRMGPEAERSARRLAEGAVDDVRKHLNEAHFGEKPRLS